MVVLKEATRIKQHGPFLARDDIPTFSGRTEWYRFTTRIIASSSNSNEPSMRRQMAANGSDGSNAALQDVGISDGENFKE